LLLIIFSWHMLLQLQDTVQNIRYFLLEDLKSYPENKS
jgi:hypothetical protein